MGQRRQRLAVLALIALGATAGVASADNKTLARDLFNLGIDEYKAKQYEAAAISFQKSNALDPRTESLYALAQAERLAGRCKDAIPHYEELLTKTKDEKSVGKIKENIELCKQIEAGKPAPEESATKDAEEVELRDAPTIEYRTVVRTERSRDVLSIVLFAGGGVAISGAAATYLVARSQRNDADDATSLEEYNDKFDSSRRLKWISYATAGVGVSLITVAIIRVVRGGESSSETREVAVAPIPGGSMVSWSARW